jgi:DNA-directed RNA polymerase subunit M/transcription elongation factor TFIIS
MMNYKGTVTLVTLPVHRPPDVPTIVVGQGEAVDTVATVLKRVVFPDNTRIGDSHIIQFINLKRRDGTSLLSLARRDLIYEIATAAYTIGIDDMLKFINESITADGTTETIVFESDTMKSASQVHFADLERMRGREEAVSGLVECPECHTMKTMTFIVQIRRSDEPPSLINKCNNCGHKWRIG